MDGQRGVPRPGQASDYDEYLTPEEIKKLQKEKQDLFRLLEERARAKEGTQGSMDEIEEDEQGDKAQNEGFWVDKCLRS